MCQLSVIVPMYNEEANARALYERLAAVLDAYSPSYELVFVDDGSTDGTLDILQSLRRQDNRIGIVQFVRNFGQQVAITAGLRHASGQIVVVTDGDLQRPPEAIPALVDKLAEGYDVVYGVRDSRTETWIRRAGSSLLGRLLAALTGAKALEDMSAFVALSEPIVRDLRLYNEKEPFFLGLVSYLSYGRSASIPIQESARHGGTSKYNVSKLFGLALSFVCSASTLPLRIILTAGILLMLLSATGLLAWLVLSLLFCGSLQHASTALILGAMGLLSGMQMASVGILAEYMRKTYLEARDRPLYIVRQYWEPGSRETESDTTEHS